MYIYNTYVPIYIYICILYIIRAMILQGWASLPCNPSHTKVAGNFAMFTTLRTMVFFANDPW